MYRSYESHVRLYLRPHLATVRRDRLRVGHLDAMFEASVERNEQIAEYRASGDPRKIEAVKWQRPVGPTSLHRIKETLRAILRPAVDQGLRRRPGSATTGSSTTCSSLSPMAVHCTRPTSRTG